MKTLSGHNIITVTQGGILYHDEDGAVQWIDFKSCNMQWCDARANLLDSDFQTVGWQHYYPNYIELCVDAGIRFEFEFKNEAREPLETDKTFFEAVKDFKAWNLRYESPPRGISIEEFMLRVSQAYTEDTT